MLAQQPACALPTVTYSNTYALLPDMMHRRVLQLMRILERIHIHDELPRKFVFVHTHDAVRAAQEALDGGETGSIVLISDGKDVPAGKADSYATHQQ
jgi:hypothetical protein